MYMATMAQMNLSLVFHPLVYEKRILRQNPSPLSFRLRLARCTPKVFLFRSSDPSRSASTRRLSRSTRTEAQGVLFDYLHKTRNLCFTDAEHISNNSPHFLQNLLLKIDTDDDVSWSLTKFLRYNPINEFEPFLESLGLSPSELPSLLPNNFMYLDDNGLFLENFHVLCNYGVPRGRIGRIYKEASAIFGYERGLLASKLEAYENLGLSMSTVIKLACSCPSVLIGGVDREFVQVLEKLNRIGLDNDWIGGYLSWKGSYNWRRMLDTVDFLDKVGYSKEQSRNLFKTNPLLLFEGSGKKVYAIFGWLLKLGLKMHEVYSLFKQNPLLLSAKCGNNLSRAVDILSYTGMGAEEIANFLFTHMELLCSSTVKGRRALYKESQATKDNICQVIRENPLKLFCLANKSLAFYYSSKDLEKITFLMRLGYVENSDEMAKALKKFRGRGDKFQERFDCLVQAGLDANVVSSMVKRAPMVLLLTKDVIKKKIDYLVNYLAYQLDEVVTFPAYLCYDMERIEHRFRMYRWLIERDVATRRNSLSSILACSDAVFVKYFVVIHSEGPAMWESIRNVPVPR